MPTPKQTADLIATEGLDHATTIQQLVDNLAAYRGLPRPWNHPTDPRLPVLVDVAAIGAVHEILLAAAEGKRKDQGSWYTPAEVADYMAAFTIGPEMDRLLEEARDPVDLLRVCAYDPACGAGVFLAAAGRRIARRYAEVLTGSLDSARAAAPHLMLKVATHCLYGVDIDPVAVDLAKAAVWLEGDGSWPIDQLDRNIVAGDALAGTEPPALTERLAEQSADAA